MGDSEVEAYLNHLVLNKDPILGFAKQYIRVFAFRLTTCRNDGGVSQKLVGREQTTSCGWG